MVWRQVATAGLLPGSSWMLTGGVGAGQQRRTPILPCPSPWEGAAMLSTLGAGDWSLWRAARLAALSDSAEAFPGAAAEWAEGGEEQWRDRLLDATALKIVAVGSNASAVGLVRGVIEGDSAWLHSLWVRPDYRGSGLGGRLIAAVEDWARPRAPRVRLKVVTGNQPAIELYRRHGFVQCANLGPPLSDHGRELVMEKVLV